MVSVTVHTAYLAIALWIAYYLLNKARNRSRSDIYRLAYPKPGHWFWGHEKEVLYDHNYSDTYSEWMGRQGAVLRTKAALWHPDILVIADPLALWHIQAKNAGQYGKSPLAHAMVRRLMGESLVWVEGAEHRRMRAAFSPCFTSQKVREMEPIVLRAADMLANTMKKYVADELSGIKSGESKPPVIVNLTGWTAKATLDVIGRVGFDYDFGFGESPEAKELFRLWEDQALISSTLASFFASFVLRAFPFIVSLPVEAMEKQETYKLYVRSIGKKIAESKIERISAEQDDTEDDPDIISAFIRYSRKEGKEVSADNILDHFTTFIQAGNDTTATTINYAIHALAQDPDVQKQLRKELDDFGREPTFDDLHNKDVLKFLDAVTKEALRMFPVGAHSELVAKEDDVIPLSEPIRTADGTLLSSIRIQKGQVVGIPRVSINTRPCVWGPDGEVFRPSRWLDTETSDATPQVSLTGWNNLSVFGEGSRLCIGYRLAVFEMKAVLAALIRVLKFEEVNGIKIKKRNLFTLQPLVVASTGEAKGILMEGPWLPVKISLIDQD